MGGKWSIWNATIQLNAWDPLRYKAKKIAKKKKNEASTKIHGETKEES